MYNVFILQRMLSTIVLFCTCYFSIRLISRVLGTVSSWNEFFTKRRSNATILITFARLLSISYTIRLTNRKCLRMFERIPLIMRLRRVNVMSSIVTRILKQRKKKRDIKKKELRKSVRLRKEKARKREGM